MKYLNFTAIDLAPAKQDFFGDVVKGLSHPQKSLPPKYFYDAAGSALFDQICELPEYYVTRTELGIMRDLPSFSIGGVKRLAVVELGGASSFKFRHLIRSMPDIGLYIPVDISRDMLFAEGERLARDFPDLHVVSICADYEQLENFSWSDYTRGYTPIVYFPGSTLGNLKKSEAIALLKMCRNMIGDDGYMILGCDLLKPVEVLIPAYDDKQGVTASFNLNILRRINSELGGDFNVEQFKHQIRFNQLDRKIEMHLVSQVRQTVQIGECEFHFAAGESIHTEDSHKFQRSDLEEIADLADLTISQWRTDANNYFALILLSADNVSKDFAYHISLRQGPRLSVDFLSSFNQL